MKNVYKWFRKKYTNQYNAVEILNTGEQIPMLYHREDLSRWAKEAFDNNKYFFYARPVDKNNPYGKLELCEPEFEYVLRHPLTQEELNEIFGEEVYVDLKDFILKSDRRKNND